MSELLAYHPRSFAKWIRDRADERRWINWRDDGKPIHPVTGNVEDANPADPRTWCTLDEALARDPQRVGIAITRDDNLAFIDFDWKYAEGKKPSKAQLDMMERLEDLAWWEQSRSGLGAHALVFTDKTKLPARPRTKGDGVEVYLQYRFCYLTFKKMRGTPETVKLSKYFPFVMEESGREGSTVDVDYDAEPRTVLVEKALSRRPRLARLVEGRVDGELANDRSDYDWALAQECKRAGLDFAEFRYIVEEKLENPRLSQVSKRNIDLRRALIRTWARAPDQSAPKEFDDVEVEPQSEAEEEEAESEDFLRDPMTQDEFADMYAADARSKAFKFVLTSKNGDGFWRGWDGARWQTEAGRGMLLGDLSSFSQVLRGDAPVNQRRRMGSYDFLSGAEKLLRRHAATMMEDWDKDSMILNTPGGPVDLATGRMLKAKSKRLLSKMTSLAPGPEGSRCPNWERFLRQVFDGDEDLVHYIQLALGYALTGSVGEHALFFLYGSGGNGKSTLTKVVEVILKDYGWAASSKLLTASKMERHPTELMSLMGRRFVVANEIPRNATWDEELLKKLSSGDTITARGMRMDEVTFEPSHKLFIAANNKPRFHTVDDAIRRRLHLIPFDVNLKERFGKVIPNFDLWLVEHEGPAILRWMIDGCIMWQIEGLKAPEVVEAATDEYIQSQDSYSRWFDDRCVERSDLPAEKWPRTGELFADWKSWCQEHNEYAGREAEFVEALKRRGIQWQKIKAKTSWKHIALASDLEDQDD